LFLPPTFWQCCEAIRKGNTTSINGELQPYIFEFYEMRDKCVAIYFPFVHASHWFLGIVDIKRNKLQFGDSLTRSLPQQFEDILKTALDVLFELDYERWSPVERTPLPQQMDGNSCGVIALSSIEYLISQEANIECTQWEHGQCDQFRVAWLRRIICRHKKTLAGLDPVEGCRRNGVHLSPPQEFCLSGAEIRKRGLRNRVCW